MLAIDGRYSRIHGSVSRAGLLPESITVHAPLDWMAIFKDRFRVTLVARLMVSSGHSVVRVRSPVYRFLAFSSPISNGDRIT